MASTTSTQQLVSEKDNLVTWDSPEDTQNPKNWTPGRKWLLMVLSTAFILIVSITTSMVAVALTAIGDDLHISSKVTRNMVQSIFLVGYAFGGLLSGPLSEVYGRRLVLMLFNVFFLAFNTACGFATDSSQIIVCRAFAGFGAGAAMVIGIGVLSDCWSTDQLGLAVSIYSSMILLGPTFGPLIGGIITQFASWHWLFWAISIAGVIVQTLSFFFGRETYSPFLLRRKAMRLRVSTGNKDLHTKWEASGNTTSTILKKALVRPAILLGTQPIFQLLALFACYIYGLVYFALVTFAQLWIQGYGESTSIAGLNYLALGLGYVAGLGTCSRVTDAIYQYLKRTRGNGTGVPEYRLPMMIPGALLVSIGLIWYGWSAKYRLHWIMPDIGMVLFGMGVKFSTQSVQLYALDVYPTYAASAGAGSIFLRSLCGFSFPLFAPALYAALDYGWGNTLLAFIATLMGVLTPAFLWKYGSTLRRKSPYATGD